MSDGDRYREQKPDEMVAGSWIRELHREVEDVRAIIFCNSGAKLALYVQ